MTEASCIVCGTSFEGRADAVYCSDRCRQQAQRDRAKSECMVTVGGLVAPVSAFTATSGAFGEIGHTVIELTGLKGEPGRDASGRIGVELHLNGSSVWAGDLQRIERSVFVSGAITLEAAGLEQRLASQRWGADTWIGLSAPQLAAGAAQRAGLTYSPHEQPLDPRPLGATIEAEGAHSALELLLLVSREQGLELAVRDGALMFGPAIPAEARTLQASNVTVTTFGSGAPVSVIVRSRQATLVGGSARDRVLTTGRVADIAPGLPVYIATVFNRRQYDIDALAESLARDLAAGLVQVRAEVDDPTVAPGMPVHIEAAGERTLRIARVRRTFSAENGLRTEIEALHLPAPPVIANTLPGMPARVTCPSGIAA